MSKNIVISNGEFDKIIEDMDKEPSEQVLKARIKFLELQNAKLVSALNRIGMLAMSEHAYTSEFTERVQQIVKEALNEKK